MTDISRHFNGILKILLSTAEPTDIPEMYRSMDNTVWEQIRQFLPDSYLLSYVALRNDAGYTSRHRSYCILDKSIAEKLAHGKNFNHVDSALMVISAARLYPDPDGFKSYVNQVESLKVLKKHPKQSQLHFPEKPPVAQRRETFPKYRLPLTVWVFQKIQEFVPSSVPGQRGSVKIYTRDEYIALLMAKVESLPIAVRPDFIYATGYDLVYRNPLLEQRPLTGYDIGLSKIEPLHKPRTCYQCGETFLREHFYYERLCVRCGDINYRKRQQSADLSGRIALVTGGRVKIGYQTALKLLRAGARVIVTSRFPHDAARRFASEPDFDTWRENLHIYGLDMRHMPGLQAFITHVKSHYPHLDILVNNAAQTVRRPPAYYTHLIETETRPRHALPANLQGILKTVDDNAPALPQGGSLLSPVIQASPTAISAQLSQIPLVEGDDDTGSFPHGQYDADGQQIDNRVLNSWTLHLDEVPIPEMLEVQMINVIAPEMMVSQFKALMSKSPFADRYIVNVSAAEGRFGQGKTPAHIHTNMAKAALNMLTYSAAPYYAESGIYMTGVDPGWVSDQAPTTSDTERAERQLMIPLDAVDGASRVCDPIFVGVMQGEFLQGVFLKHYAVVAW